jgi:hypothetical protein
MLLVKLMTDDLLSLFIYSSSHARTGTASSLTKLKANRIPQCNAMQWIGSSTDAEHTQLNQHLGHTKYQAKAADECLTSIRRVAIAWQTK